MIREALAGSRLVTLTGAAGTGKTRLAIEAAHQLGGRHKTVAFADLAPVRDPQRLPIAIARSLGLRPTTGDAAEDDVAGALNGRSALLVLDNFEQVLDGAVLLTRLLAAAPRLRLLITSRIPLRLYGETVLRIPPLSVNDADGPMQSEAVQLFVQRARAARTGFAPTGKDLAAVVDICRALDGLPLGIELAAARAKLYSPHALRTLLNDRLSLLIRGPRDLPHRQQTLRATLDWSHELLDPDQRCLFACLGVFTGPFDAIAAAAVVGDGPDAQEMLARLEELVDQSLVEVVPGATPSFRLLETVREYALSQLTRRGDEDAVSQRHLEHYLSMATAAENMTGREQRARHDQLEAAYANIRAALDFAQRREDGASRDAGLRLAIALVPLWLRRGSLAEGAWHLDGLLAAGPSADATEATTWRRALVEQAVLECFRGGYARAVVLAERGRALCQDADDHGGLSRAHRVLGEAALAVGDLVTAEAHFRRQLGEAELTDSRADRAASYNMLGQVARHRGDYDEANALLSYGLRLLGAMGDQDRYGTVLNSLGEVARDVGDAGRARCLFAAALRRHREFGSTRDMAYDLEGLAAAAALNGDGRLALRHLGAAQALRSRIGGPLPPVEEAILGRILQPAIASLSDEDRDREFAGGHDQPLAVTVDRALAAAIGDPADPWLGPALPPSEDEANGS